MAQLNESAVWHGFTNMRRFLQRPICVVEAQGAWVRDAEGNTYLNAFSSLLNLNLGGGQADIADRIAQQARQLPYFPIERATHGPAEEYARRLVAKMPAGLNHVFYASTGSEANETVIKTVRQYQRIRHGDNTDKWEIIALDRGYHGVTLGALSATGSSFSRWRNQFRPLLPGFHHVSSPYAYRCKFGCGGACTLKCADAVRAKIEEVGPTRIGGVLVEPVLGVGGVVKPPREYHERLRAICDEYGIVLAYDEVVTGFGRLGTWFGADYFGVTPDLMALSKGINGGYLPFGAVVVKDEIYRAFMATDMGVFANGSTTNGNPICCASALATLDIIERDELIERGRATGTYMFELFDHLHEYPIVGEIRGAGLLMGIELVRDRSSREPIPDDQWEIIESRLALSGLILGSSSGEMGATIIGVAPPLTTSREDIEELYRRIAQVIERYSTLIR